MSPHYRLCLIKLRQLELIRDNRVEALDIWFRKEKSLAQKIANSPLSEAGKTLIAFHLLLQKKLIARMREKADGWKSEYLRSLISDQSDS